MPRCFIPALAALLVLLAQAQAPAQHKPEVIERGKKATALVEVATAEGRATGSAFCIDTSGLFITNAHVVGAAATGEGQVRLVVDIGRKTQRSLRAKVLRADDALDLALLKVDADLGLTPLELGRDDALSETNAVLTFGFPFGHDPTVRGEAYPDITVLPSRITALRRDKGRLEGIQFDNQLNPGNSGGPVVDEAGRVVGVAVATVRGAAMNLAIPVSRLSEFLVAPGLVFDPPPLVYKDRSRAVTWTIKVQPATPGAKLPESLSVSVTITNGIGEPRTVNAQPVGGGTFQAKVTPVPRDPDRMVELTATFPSSQRVQAEVKDGEVRVGGVRFLLSDLRTLIGGPLPGAHPTRGGYVPGPILGLGKVKRRVGGKTVSVDLNLASMITVRLLDPPSPVQAVEALVEARQGEKVLAAVHKRANLSGAPTPVAVAVRMGANVVIVPVRPPVPLISRSQGPSDDGMVETRGVLDVDGTPRGAGGAIRPPQVEIGAAHLAPFVAPAGDPATEEMKYVGHTGEVCTAAVSPDGRSLISGSKDGTVRIWDLETGRVRQVLSGHRGYIIRAIFSPDGRRALSGGEDKVIRLWDVATGRLLRSFLGHSDCILGLAFTPDGKSILSSGGGQLASSWQNGHDFDIRVWDVDSGNALALWPGHTGMVFTVRVSPDGRLALTASSDGTARLWDVATGRVVRSLPSQREPGMDAAFTPDGKRVLVSAEGNLVRIFDVSDGREVGVLRGHTGKVDSLAVSRDGSLVLSASWVERSFRVWSLPEGKERALARMTANPCSAVLTPDGRKVICSCTDNSIRRYALPEPALARARDTVPPPSDPLTVRPGGTIHDVAVGGGGRYLFLTLRDAHKLAVFDANAGGVVTTIPLAGADALVAAGAEMLVIAYPNERLIQRWDLGTMSRRGESIPSPIRGRLKGLALGSDSEGPLLAAWTPEAGPGATDQARFSFLDIKTLKVLKAGPISTGGFQGIGQVSPSGGSVLLHPSLRDRVHLRASAGGGLFAIWHTDSSPSGFQTLEVRKGTLRAIYNHDALAHLAPGPDGLTVYTGLGGPRDSQGKELWRTDPRPGSPPELTIPSPDPSYYLSIAGANRPLRPASSTDPITASVHTVGDGKRLQTVWELDEMAGVGRDESWIRDDFSIEKRFHLIPAAQLLITIPPSNDRLVLRRLDITRLLDQQGGDYLLVTSPAVVTAEAGREFRHQIAVKSRKGSVTYALTSGPDGMVVSPTGQVTWKAAAKDADQEIIAVLTIGDASGQERFHTLRIRVR